MAYVRGFERYVFGLSQLQDQFDRLGKFPKKALTKSAKEGMKQPLADAKSSAPVSQKKTSGTLKKSIKRKMETPHKKTKSVYQMTFDAKYVDIFKGNKIRNVGVYGGEKDYGYYPISMEYGFFSRNGYTRGQYFIRQAIEKNELSSLEKMVRVLNKELDNIVK